MDRLQGAIAIVTGASSGVGAGIVRRLHAAGATVAFCSNRPDEGAELASSLGKERILFIEADCAVEDDIRRVIKTVVEHFGGIDCLVNNVGWHPPTKKKIDDIEPNDVRSLFNLNVTSYFLFSQQALPYLRKSTKCPSIINISSMGSILGQEASLPYVATKGAIAAMTRALAIDEAEHGVRVNTVSPSCVNTPLLHNFVSKRAGENATQADIDRMFQIFGDVQLNGRIADPEDIGDICVFLASRESSYLTGIDLFASGGAELNYGVKTRMGH